MIARLEPPLMFRPRLVLADGNSAQAALTGRQFRRLGWEVHLAATGPEARRLARLVAPQVVVLDADLRDESGWLTCAKMKMENPHQKVLLVTGRATAADWDFAQLVGAAGVVGRADGVLGLVAEVRDTVSAAG